MAFSLTLSFCAFVSLSLCVTLFAFVSYSGSSVPCFRRHWRIRRSSKPLPCCRRVCADTVAALVFAAAYLRIFARKSRNLAAVPVLPAVHFGDKVCKLGEICEKYAHKKCESGIAYPTRINL
jgi:hypothetical protein